MSVNIVPDKGNIGVEGVKRLSVNPGANQHDKKRTSVVRRLARRSMFIKLSGGYLDYMRYYFSETTTDVYTTLQVDEKIERSKHCQHTWQKESKNGVERFRGIGDGDRHYCPLCGSYYQLVLSREATRQLLLVQEALDVSEGVSTDFYGFRVVLPLYKPVSQRIDDLLFSGESGKWSKEVANVYKLADNWLKKHFSGVPNVKSLDFTGESAPGEAHYHINVYLLPQTLTVKGNFVSSEPLKHYYDDDELKAMRDTWRDLQNETYRLNLTEGDFKISYIAKEAQLYHWLRYLYRHSLSDIWRGWRGYGPDTGILQYRYTKPKNGKRIPSDIEVDKKALDKAFLRLELIPKHFKRIRWYGSLSDGNRGKTMSILGLQRLEREEYDDGEDNTWQVDGYYSFVRFESDGIVLRPRQEGAYFSDDDNDSQLLKVVDSAVNYSPKGVKIGRRVVWVEPGSHSPGYSNA